MYKNVCGDRSVYAITVPYTYADAWAYTYVLVCTDPGIEFCSRYTQVILYSPRERAIDTYLCIDINKNEQMPMSGRGQAF